MFVVLFKKITDEYISSIVNSTYMINFYSWFPWALKDSEMLLNLFIFFDLVNINMIIWFHMNN